MNASTRALAVLAALLFAVATGLGAAKTHLLNATLTPHAEGVVTTAIEYQLFYALGLLVTALLHDRLRTKLICISGWVMFAGIVLFCGSVYAHYLCGFSALAPLVPVGGTLMIVSWLVLCAGLIFSRGTT